MSEEQDEQTQTQTHTQSPVESTEPHDEDLTVVFTRPVSDETIMAVRPVSDETIAVARPASDETIVVARRDATVASDRPVDDATVVVTRVDTDETVVSARPAHDDSATSAPEAPPSRPRHADSGLDPTRTIAPAPGVDPWAQLPEGERGTSRVLPVSYGARPHADMPLQAGADEIQRRIGPAPAEAYTGVRAGREALPSLEKRERRLRVRTLVAYGVVLVVCVAGFLGLAAFAFGW